MAVSTGAGLAASCTAKKEAAASPKAGQEVVPAPKGEWMAGTPASAYRAYRSKPAKTADAVTWVQIDLGATHPIDSVKVYPASERLFPGRDEYYAGEGFPVRFKIEVSNQPDFRNASTIVDHTATGYPNPKGTVQSFHARGVEGRYLRLTATRLMNVRGRKDYYLALAKIGVYSGGKEIATERPVTVDPGYGNYDDVAQVTRAERAGGEGVFLNNPGNVTQANTWKPPVDKARKPLGGVSLNGGVFQTAMENNISYLLNSYSVDELLRQFRERAGIPNPPGLPKPKTKFWEADLAGSNAGRFLMGAGNTVRWIDHPELRRRLNAVVDGIAKCRQPNGYIMAYPEDTIFFSERGAYTRAWLTHGLIEAGYAGNPKAFELLRGYYDWFNQSPYLPYLMRFATQGGQGMIANTRLYSTPVGKPADIQVIQRYFQENYWLNDLAVRDERAIWQYPYDRPHCYLLTNVLAYLDLYRATGEPRYLNAVQGAWDLFHDQWENIGGSTSIIEFVVCPPKSFRLHAKLEELCGNAFWAFLNQRLHALDPDKEAYVTEIERSIYNVALANLAGPEGFRYHALLTHQKEKPTQINTCCEGQGTRLIGSLPEHIYSIASDGLYVNLFEPSTIRWKQHGQALSLKMTTGFPFHSDVRLEFSAARPVGAKIRVRVPSWAAREMAVQVNGRHAATGRPGSYVAIDRTWSSGDTVAFQLPAELRVKRYT
ncbi:MAG TPA: beta-L-arabinofuranosidase domain-containing protein, partial [Terriglobia bacterium]|nr:beta-L-arabinofuranosidase domain-containing protein [Terriglobia bacterium]